MTPNATSSPGLLARPTALGADSAAHGSLHIHHVRHARHARRSAPAAARAALMLLERLEHGALEAHLPDGSVDHFGPGGEPRASISVHDWSVFGATLSAGDIGLADGWIAGHWTTPDLPGLLRLCLANRERLDAMLHGRGWIGWLHRLRHLLRRNSRTGSRRNIQAHYDLGNDFYALWLDETMNYSSAWFDGRPAQPLAQAQRAKVRRAIAEAGAGPGHRVLEIGCGWGAVAEAVAAETGARLTGVTLSREQLAHAQGRLARAGLADRVDLRLQDYRDIADAPFDALISIEMFEAVGRAYWPTYFETVRRCLAPGGRACIQTITIRDDLFERYVRSTDFIQQAIFPGGLLPSVSEFHLAARRAGLVVERQMAFGADYAETLRRWRSAFLARQPEVLALGFDDRFLRTWDFYLAYCEAAFDSGSTDVVQFTLRHA